MKTTALLLTVTLLSIILQHKVEADFYYNHVAPKADELASSNLKCIPGRTVVTMEKNGHNDSSESEYEDEIGQSGSKMNSGSKEENCKICICSADGLNEACSVRVTKDLDRCNSIANIANIFKSNDPYDLESGLSYRMRRDYFWYNDEIPYHAEAKCKRGYSYYSNNIRANDTDIDVAPDIESLLDYSDSNVCFQCICSVDGESVNCINRDIWFCDYYRYLRGFDTPRDKQLLQQDSPDSFFNKITWRVKRTMDSSIYNMLEAGGDSLCCSHPDGHRRHIHNNVRNKLLHMKRKVLRENLLGESPGGDYADFIVNNDSGTDSKKNSCIPFLSQYTDCSEENLCSGCINCVCTANGEWSCKPVMKCRSDLHLEIIDKNTMEEALANIEAELAQQKGMEQSKSKTSFSQAPDPAKKEEDLLLDDSESYRDVDIDRQIVNIIERNKRSIDLNLNETREDAKIEHTTDEIKEDTLKNNNICETLNAEKVFNLSNISGKTGLLNSENIVKNESLHNELSETKGYDPHIARNKIDSTVHDEDKPDGALKKFVTDIIGNKTQKQRNKVLSKLIVSELKNGSELIGDNSAPIMSNITFTLENDTLSAMAFIAGNLLHQLWNIEKGSSEETKETEDLKYKKVSDVFDLFKEPLDLRQEKFIKSALEHLTEAIDKDKIIKNKMNESKNVLRELNYACHQNDSYNQNNETNYLQKKDIIYNIKTNESAENNQAGSEAISKIKHVLKLINKFHDVRKSLHSLKQSSDVNTEELKDNFSIRKSGPSKVLTKDESDSLNVYGKVLEKITKLIVPPKKGKKIVKSIRSQNIFRKSDDVAQKLKNNYGIENENSIVTTKDKILLDYMSTVQRNPYSISDNFKDPSQLIPDVEGDILLNLSQFFKIKSFVDLLKILESENNNTHTNDVTTQLPEATTHIIKSTSTEFPSNLSKTKAKLTEHLKLIIEDLNELQIVKGVPDSSISDTLPSVYNTLNDDKNKHSTSLSSVDKLAQIFSTLQKELTRTKNRRNSILIEPRPKSVIVWERIVKNFVGKGMQNSQLFLSSMESKSFDDLKKIMGDVESTSKTYKNKGVSPSKRLVLLKTLQEETKKYINALEDIKNLLENIKNLSIHQQNDISDFIHNADININLDSKVAKTLNKTKLSNVKDYLEFGNTKRGFNEVVRQIPRSNPILDFTSLNLNKNMKLSRNDIIHHLIKNRMRLYIKAKELKSLDTSNDINYAIAKKILIYLDTGNYSLARELYKYIVNQKKFEDMSSERTVVSSAAKRTAQSSQSFMKPGMYFEK